VRSASRPFVPPPAPPPAVALFDALVAEAPRIDAQPVALALPELEALPAYPKPRPAAAPPRRPARPQAPAPELQPMLTPDERAALDRQVGARIRRAAALLRAVEGTPLSGEQAALAAQVKTFLRQAEEARNTDLLRANNLAERAEVLAVELSRRVR